MIQELNAYSAMIKGKRLAAGLTSADLALKTRVSTKTITLIEGGKWPANGELSPQQQRGQSRALIALAAVLDFDSKEWLTKLKLPTGQRVANIRTTKLGREELEYLLQIVKISGPLNMATLLDLLEQRGNEKGAPI